MLELIFQGFLEWAYGLALECWQYFSMHTLIEVTAPDSETLEQRVTEVEKLCVWLAPYHDQYAAAPLPVSKPKLAQRYHSAAAGQL